MARIGGILMRVPASATFLAKPPLDQQAIQFEA